MYWTMTAVLNYKFKLHHFHTGFCARWIDTGFYLRKYSVSLGLSLKPGTGNRRIGESGNRRIGESGTGNREQRTGNREQGTGNREQGLGNKEQGTGNREQGTGNREQGTGNREQGTGNRERGPGTGDRKREIVNGEWGIFKNGNL